MSINDAKAELIEELRKKEKQFSSAYEPETSLDDAIIGNSLEDITEARQAERELQRYNDLLRAIIEAAPLAAGMETLLVAEDEEIVRIYMKKILERAGYQVIVANDSEDAVTRFKEHDGISLVLSDVVMPRKNGREMADEIRKMKAGVTVVFISGYAADIMHKKGMIEEGMEFITKPFKKDELLQKVREMLDRD